MTEQDINEVIYEVPDFLQSSLISGEHLTLLEEDFEAEPDYYHLVSDDDGHWYVINVNDDEDFKQWVEDTVNGRDSEFSFEDCSVGDAPGLVHFRHYHVVGGNNHASNKD